jgi:hypothetical protein
LFVNGVAAGTTSIVGSISTSASPLRIGGNSFWGEFFEGRIDEVRVYNRPLSQSEIVADMNTPVGGFTADNTPPSRMDGEPGGVVAATQTPVQLRLTTNENATCRYSPVAGTPYAAMSQTFATTGATTHTTTVSGLTSGTTYNFYVLCVDALGNANTDDFVIRFWVASSLSTAISNFSGTEAPLSEGSMWDSAGAWVDLRKNNGA